LIEVTPPKYHVYVECEKDKEKTGIRFNLTEEELMRTFVLPFNEGKPFWFGTKLLSPSKVDRAVIFWSSEDCNKLVLPSGEGVTSCKDKKLVIENICIGNVNGVHCCTEKFLLSTEKKEENSGLTSVPLVSTGRKRVHIIHGKDEAMKQAVAKTLEKLGFEPVILHEQPSQGRNLLGEFSEYSDVTFAVVLLSPDDTSAPAPKASQKVILELGFFLGKLGKRSVLPLYRETRNFDLPPDIAGNAYTKFDEEGTWKYKLAKELQNSGYRVDLKKIG
jgi:predicted nucleotide-binding protein